MKRIFLFLLLALALITPTNMFAQQGGGRDLGWNFARDYDNWQMQSTTAVAATSATMTLAANPDRVTPGGNTFYPILTTVSVGQLISVLDGADSEIVEVTTASCTQNSLPGTCSFTATFANAHRAGVFIRSGTGGLQEAAIDLVGGIGTVYVGPGARTTTTNITTDFYGTSADSIVVVDARAGSHIFYTCPSACETAGNFVASLTIDNAGITGEVAIGAAGVEFEGTTADAFETTIAVTDPTADNTITFPDAGGNVAVFANANTKDVNVIFEGTTADDFETTVTITDPTADRTVTIPNGGGAVVLSSLTTNATDVANSVTGASNAFVFEGATADAFETSIAPVDATADRTVTLPNLSGVVNVGVSVDILLCGQQANAGTTYTSPVSGFPEGALYAAGASGADLDYAIGGSGCDAEDNSTEGTADEVLFANNAVQIIGLICKASSSGSNGVVFNHRSATASLTPDYTVTIPTSETSEAFVSTPATVAAGATFALRMISTEDLSTQDAWCIAKAIIVP